MAKRMTREEKDYFLKQVERKGKAKEVQKKDEITFKKYEGEYKKIVHYLRDNVKRFLVSEIVRDDRYMDWVLLKEILEEEKDDALVIFKDELNKGNVPDLNLILFMMHTKYMTMWRERHDGELR